MMRSNNSLRKYVPSLLLFLLFEAVAITLWLVKDNLFYLLNFSYIGCCLALGTALFTAGKRYARHFVQLAVGCYMLLYLGVISRENMQLEGFWYYLFPVSYTHLQARYCHSDAGTAPRGGPRRCGGKHGPAARAGLFRAADR